MSKGGSTSSTVAVPEYIEDAARRNLTEADKIRRLGFIPEYGPTVAAFTPMQDAAFQSTAQAAGAFGLPGGGMSMQDISGGMPAPTTYAGGVRGYSSLPIYEQALEAFGQARPGQKRYAESFFIDPVTGLPGSNMQAPVDYTVASTPGDLGGIGAGGGAGAGGGGGAGAASGSTLTGVEVGDYSQVIADSVGLGGFDPTLTAEEQMTPEQYAEYQSQSMSDAAQLAADNIYMNNLGNANSTIVDTAKGLLNIEPSFDSPSSAGSYGGSLVTGGLSGNLTGIPGIAGNIADNILSSAAPEYAIGLQGQNFAESGGSTYDPNMAITNPITGKTTTGGYDFDPTAFSSDYGNSKIKFSDLTPVPEPAPVGFTSLPNTGMTAIPGYTTPLPTTFEGPIPTGTTLPTGSTIVNTYDGGFGSRPAHSTDNDKPAGPGDTGYEQAQLLDSLQSGGTGIIYEDDRRKVYLDGVLIGNPKGAEDAREMLAKAKEEKAAAPQPSSASSSSQSSQTIKSGDTLSAIAKREGTTVNEIMKANPQIKDKNKIQAGAAITIPKAVSASVNSGSSGGSSDSGSSGGGGTVLCTAYASMGYLPSDIWSLDTRYGIKRFRQDPVMVSGYRLWASPIAEFIKTDTLAARAVRAALWPMVRVWAEEMAHQMKPEKYSGNKFGKLVMAMGEPFSYAVGATLLKRNAQKEL